MKKFGLMAFLVILWVWAGEVNLPYDLWFERMWPYSCLNLADRLEYYSTPIILALLLMKKKED